jgi:intraflagellar transport protein 140
MFRLSLGAPVLQLSWWSGRGALAAVTEDETVFLNESVMNGLVCGDLSVIQDNATEVTVYIGDASESAKVNTGIQIRGLAVGRSCFVCWSGKIAKVYRVDPSSHRIEALEPIKCTSMAMAIADASFIVDEAWFVVENSTVRINNFMGTQKGMINFSEAEGSPQHIDVNGRYVAVMTNKGCVKIVNVHTPTKPKLQVTGNLFSGKTISTSVNFDPTNMKVRSIKVNSSGTVVAVLCDIIEPSQRINYPDTKLYIYDAVRGSLATFDFATLKRYPLNVMWDESDDRLFCCESYRIRDVLPSENGSGSKSSNAKLSTASGEEKSPADDKSGGDGTSSGSGNKDQVANTEVYLMFATGEQGILMQDSISSEDGYGPLIGFNVPKIYYRKSSKTSRASEQDESTNTMGNGNILVKVMRDFMGMNNVNDVIKSALLDFSFYLTLGKLDDAYRVVKEINSPAIWENMAQMCVKTKRIDVAEVCLGNMGNARGAAAVREAKKEGNLEVTIGVLAIQLGLLDDAAALFREAGRYDMLNRLYQASGFWEKAIATAEEQDRIHLKTTHYKFAKYLESVGHVDDAIEHFERSQNARTEVPRMLFHLGRIDELGEYVMRSEDTSLAKWWASYLESIDRLDKAKKFYSKAKDYLSLVRIYCFKVSQLATFILFYYLFLQISLIPFSFFLLIAQGDFQKAAEIVTETGDRASAYHFARQLENQGEFQEAITFYSMSGCYNHSIRLARAHNLDAELMRFALKSTPALMIECAQHFEMKEEYDKAVQLYHKGGDIPRALELCFRIGEENPKHPHAAIAFDMLNSIAQDLGVDSSPQTLARCADFLVQHKQYDKAIELYVMAKRYHAAIEMAMQHRVNLTDDMVEKLTPPEVPAGTATGNGIVDPSERREILKDLAKALKKQGSFTLASKKYTQAGDRVRAIKCLVRSGDTKAVIQFASISRNNEIYTLAANYLQQMNWRESMDIMKAIIMFYTKAKAFMQLAGFYDSCAQVEIDEYRDYEKAVAALNEALKYLSKETGATGPGSSATSTARAAMELQKSVEKRVLLIEKFIEAKSCMRNDPQTMIAICEALLQDPQIEEAIRIGDLLGMLIEFFYQQNSMQDAYHYLREMEDRKIQPFPYVEASIVHDIYKAVGVSRGGASSNNNGKNKQDDFETKQNDGGQRGGKHQQQHVDEDEDGVGEELEEEIDEVSSAVSEYLQSCPHYYCSQVMEEESPVKQDPRKNRGNSYGYRK